MVGKEVGFGVKMGSTVLGVGVGKEVGFGVEMGSNVLGDSVGEGVGFGVGGEVSHSSGIPLLFLSCENPMEMSKSSGSLLLLQSVKVGTIVEAIVGKAVVGVSVISRDAVGTGETVGNNVIVGVSVI